MPVVASLPFPVRIFFCGFDTSKMAVETQSFREELLKAKENLRDLDVNIKKLTGRDPSERRNE